MVKRSIEKMYFISCYLFCKTFDHSRDDEYEKRLGAKRKN